MVVFFVLIWNRIIDDEFVDIDNEFIIMCIFFVI